MCRSAARWRLHSGSHVRSPGRTVGAMCERVSADVIDPHRLEGLVDIGVDEISWRKHHKYLTLVSDHGTSTIVWGTPGKDAATLGKFFDALPEGGVEQVEPVSMDLGLAYIKAVRGPREAGLHRDRPGTRFVGDITYSAQHLVMHSPALG